MFDLFSSVVELATDTVRVVAAPVKAVVDLADAAVKPIANVVEDLADEIKTLKD